MKKQMKKLSLSRETLRTLETLDLARPAGGVNTQVANSICTCPSHAVTNCFTNCTCPTKLGC